MLSEDKNEKMKSKLKELRVMTDKILEEHDMIETKIQALKTTNTTLKGKLDKISRFGEKECKQKQLIIENCRESGQKYKGFLEIQLKVSNDEVASLHEQSGSYNDLTTLSLREELARQDSNLYKTKSQHPKYSTLIKEIESI